MTIRVSACSWVLVQIKMQLLCGEDLSLCEVCVCGGEGVEGRGRHMAGWYLFNEFCLGLDVSGPP